MDDLAWKTEDRRTSYSCAGFDVVTDTVRLPDGSDAEFDYISENNSVVILPFDTAGDVVLIEEWRQAVDRVNRGLPAGNIEDGEEPEAAAHRELAEETGHEAESMQPLVSVEPANGFADSLHHFYVARGCTPSAEQSLDENESIRVTGGTVQGLLEDARQDELRDGRTMLAVLYYRVFGGE